MTGPNLSTWALGHRSLVVFLMLVCAIAGVLSYEELGRSEDPPFTIKTMVVKVLWPGATTSETINLVTDKIEKKLEETPSLDYLRSYTKPGETVIYRQPQGHDAATRTCPTSGTRSARRCRTSRTRCRAACRGRTSTTSSATPTA